MICCYGELKLKILIYKPNVGGDLYIKNSSLVELSDKEIKDKINVGGEIIRI
jgi:hypothetical protein